MNVQPPSGSHLWFGLVIAPSEPELRSELTCKEKAGLAQELDGRLMAKAERLRSEVERLERALARADTEGFRSDARRVADALDEHEQQAREEATTRYVQEAIRDAPDTSAAPSAPVRREPDPSSIYLRGGDASLAGALVEAVNDSTTGVTLEDW